MPELPDVEVFKRYFDATGLHQQIVGVEVHDASVLANVSGAELASRLTGHTFTETSRHGKHLLATLDDEDVLVLHFGMTGHLTYYRDPDDEVEGARLVFTFANGYHMAYSDEIIFHARVHPKAPVEELDEEMLRAIYDAMKSVLTTAIENGAQPSDLPEDFIIPRRHSDATCPVCGTALERDTVGGRTTYLCPRCQRRPTAERRP